MKSKLNTVGLDKSKSNIQNQLDLEDKPQLISQSILIEVIRDSTWNNIWEDMN